MKTRSKQRRQRLRRFQLKILAYGNAYYIDRIAQLEAALSRKPRVLQIELVGVGEIPADLALLLRSVLLGRSPKTRITAVARSSLRGGSVLVWLLGDRRIIRDDARMYLRRIDLSEDEAQQSEVWKHSVPEYRDSFSEIDPEEGDYARNEKVDRFLATAFRTSREPAEDPPSTPAEQPNRRPIKLARSRQVKK